jgi:hypothetical protein
MNYYLSIIPYFGAVAAGVAPPIALSYNPNPELFCNSYDTCTEDVKPWTSFFMQINSTKNNCAAKSSDRNFKCSSLIFILIKLQPHTYLLHLYFVFCNNILATPVADSVDFNLTIGMEVNVLFYFAL